MKNKFAEKTVLLIKASLLIRNIGMYLKDYRGQIYGTYTLYLRNGLKIKLRGKTTDRQIFNDIFLRNEYPLPPDKIGVVVDVGAHIGLFALYMSKKAKKIICFEPLKENFRLLQENIKINNLDNICTYNYALSSKKGHIKIYLPKGNNFDSTSISKISDKYEIVKSVTLNSALKEFKKIDYLKMDCEGSEFDILPLSDLSKVNFMVMEYHLDKKNKKSFLTDILNKNFKINEKPYRKNLGLFFCKK